MSFAMRCFDANEYPVWLAVLKCCLSDSMFKMLVERVTILEWKVWFSMMDRLFRGSSQKMSCCQMEFVELLHMPNYSDSSAIIVDCRG